MSNGLQTYFERQSRLFMDEDMETLSQDFMLPFHVMAMKRVARFETRQKLAEALKNVHAIIVQNGVSAVRPEVSALGLTRNHRSSAWVNWIVTGPKIAKPVYNKVQYILARPDPNGPILTELMEYPDVAHPELLDVLPLL